MPLYDLDCSLHDPPIRLLDFYLDSWRSPNPPCPECSGPTERIWTVSRPTDSGTWSAFDTFADLGDGRGSQRVEVRNLGDIRRIETLTRRAWEAGFPGAQPIAYRIFNQDAGRGGRFKNCFGEQPPVAGTFRTRNKRRDGRPGEPFVTHRDIKIELDPDATMDDYNREVSRQLRQHGGCDLGEPLFHVPIPE